ncbi:MAG: hypothetical protein PHF86_10565 [Candidatus Nanoarchaeia archaeon]|nr:hypothetical protein [Candidatus Nanoarchaeia archaeon]
MKIDDDGIVTFDISVIGDVKKQSYIGTFKSMCFLTPLDTIKADKLYRELLGKDFTLASLDSKNYAFALSQLKYRLVEVPPFWLNKEIGGGHVDSNVIFTVLDKALEAEKTYKEQILKETEEIEKKLTTMIKNKSIEKEEETEITEKLNQSEEV